MGKAIDSWDVEGNYKIISGLVYSANNKSIDTSGFSLKIYYSGTTVPAQLYATFAFDKLEGIMLLAHNRSKGGDYSLDEFESACELDHSMRPGPDQLEWLMRYRAREGGMRLGKLVGGEKDEQGSFEFENDCTNSAPGFASIKISFIIFYEGNTYIFEGSRTSGLQQGDCADSPVELKDKWAELMAPEWKKAAARSSSAPQPNANRASSHPRSQLLSDAKNSTASIELTMGNSDSTIDRPVSNYIEELPSWAWDLRGEWAFTAPELAKDLDFMDSSLMEMSVEVSNNPQHTRVRRQLWASFIFGPWFHGTMRFAPKQTLTGSELDTLKKFKEACVLEPGCWPGPSPKGQEWYMRYRASGWEDGKEGCDQYQTKVSFEKRPDGKLQMKGVFVYESRARAFTAIKTKDAPPLKHNKETTVTTCWDHDKPSLRKGQRKPQTIIV
jgi:hypothetical protein